MIILTDALAWGAWLVLLFTTDPTAGAPIIFLFYASLFLALLGAFAVIGFCVRVYLMKQTEVVLRQVKRTFRQGALLALLMCIALFLSHVQWLRWWLLAVVITALGAWEHFFLTGEEGAAPQT